MPLNDLDLILNKEAIIATFPASHLSSTPEQVEFAYNAHARTHVPLGDTSKYVDTIVKWVSGVNQGSFVGAVVGDYGHGKTSFLIHVWAECCGRKIFAIPPFSWQGVSDMVDGTAAWVEYILRKTHPDLAEKAKRVHQTFKEKSLRELAESVAQQTQRDVDEVYATLRATEEAGTAIDLRVAPERLLDFCAEITAIVKEAGYVGLLILLDEPEIAAGRLSEANVSTLLFEIANGLLQRQGDYGVMVSMPENFLAMAQRTIASLPARLQARNCFPRLRDVYGSDFAQRLWSRYVTEFRLGAEGDKIVSQSALQAIGQASSSERPDLSYGPRTAVSAFAQMVYRYRESGATYAPVDFVQDILEGTVYVMPDYVTRIQEVLSLPEAEGVERTVLCTLAAFPQGVTLDVAEELGIGATVQQLLLSSALVYRRGNVLCLNALRKQAGPGPQRDELQETILYISQEYAARPDTFESARDAFIKHVIPQVFERRQGQQLLGWEHPDNWMLRKDRTRIAELRGAFRQTEKDYPRRLLVVAVGPLEADPDDVATSLPTEEEFLDIFVHLRIRWNPDTPLPEKRIEQSRGEPEQGQPGLVRLVVDFVGEPVTNDRLNEVLDADLRSPMALLYIMGQMDLRTLDRESDAEWKAVQGMLIRELVGLFFGDPALRTQVAEQTGQAVPGSAGDLLGSVCRQILRDRYPKYSTLIRQPLWTAKVQDYVNALKNQDIPASCKRAREPWQAPGDSVARAFGTSVMNLTGGAFTGFENLVAIKSLARNNLEVEFKIHPLEEELMQRITAEKPAGKVKIGDKECWWLPYEELAPIIRASGYQLEELQQITAIGQSRGTFLATKHKGEFILYCLPVDPDQMKEQLRQKLEDLVKEIEEFHKLPDYRTSFDASVFASEIESLEDEADYYSLVSRANKTFEQNHNMLPGYFDRLQSELTTIRNSASQIKTQLRNSPEAASIQSSPKGNSTWRADLAEHVTGSLKSFVQAVSAECDKVAQEADKAIADSSTSRLGSALERVNLLVAGWEKNRELSGQLGDARSKAQTALAQLRDYGKWLSLLGESDRVHEETLRLKNDPSHAAKGTELLSELRTIWDDISSHLKTRNVGGLGSYGQFAEKVKALDEKRQTYLRELRGAFEKAKEKTNRALENCGLQEARCSEVFNPDDIQGSYNRLYGEAASYIANGCQTETNDMEAQRQELLYARDILGRLDRDTVQPFIAGLDDGGRELAEVRSSVDANWVWKAGDLAEEQKKLKEALSKARDAVRQCRMALRESRLVEGELGEAAKDMLGLIPDTDVVNLKQVILKMMEHGRDSSVVLSISLDSLVELFRQGRIQVILEKPKR